MKRIVLLSGMFVAAVLCGCTDDVVDNGNKIVDNPVKEGSEILFGSSLSGDADEEVSAQSKVGTRTVYGERTSTGVPVYWKPEGDEVAIFCLQTSQPADHLVKYLVKPQEGEQHLSASVEKLEDVGLQWGTSDEHRFYAFYPARAVKGSEEEDRTGKITANIPVTQQPTSWEEGKLNGVKTYFGLPNMDYAYMYAYTSQKKSETPEGTAIDLQFKNLVTVLDITVQGPESGEQPITVTNINVSAVEGQNPILTGDFTCNIREAEDNSKEVTAECAAAGNLSEVRNTVSIPCYDREKGGFIQLAEGEQLNVKAYIIPDNDESHKIKARTLQVTVATLNGAAKRKLLQTADVTPHKINRVRLPHLEAGGTNYWMSNLDPDIYVTELSIPGSKFSFLTSDNNSDVQYQATTTEQQFLNGVRAFHVQTAAKYSYRPAIDVTNPDRYTEEDLYIAVGSEILRGESGSFWGIEFPGSPVPVKAFLEELATNLQTASNAEKINEFAVVNLTYSESATRDATGAMELTSNYETGWIVTVCNMLKKYAEEDGLPIYTGKITSNTTIKDVAGKIIVHVNINTPSLANRMTEAIYYPAIFSWWNSNYNGYVKGGTPLRWGTPVNLEETSNMTWLYQELTDVDQSVGKWTQITALLDAAKSDYEAGAHSTWYYNDIGGYFGSPSTDNVKALSAVYVPKMIRELQERNVNYSLGTMLTNFADDVQNYGKTDSYNTRELIQTIIDNNFKFALRTSGSSSQTNTYNAAYSKGGNAIGWDK